MECRSSATVTVAAVIVSKEQVQHLALVLHHYENICDLYYGDLPFNCLIVTMYFQFILNLGQRSPVTLHCCLWIQLDLQCTVDFTILTGV